MSDASIQKYLTVARKNKALLLLNIQPGRASFLSEVKAMSRWLAELNQVSLWLSKFTTGHQLPQKAFVVHQLAPRIIHGVADLKVHKNLAFVISVDGIGSRSAKEATWRTLVKPLPKGIHTGFKLFFEEDSKHGKLMTAKQVLKLRPKPEYVLYE